MSTALSTLPEIAATQIKAAREAAHLTQAEFAERMGCSVRTVQNWEYGAVYPQPPYRRKLVAFMAEQEPVAA